MIDGWRADRRARWFAFAAAVGVGVLALVTTSSAPVGAFWDDGVYLISAKSLATGGGYVFAHLPGAPAAVHFPPAWPALLSLVWRLNPSFPQNMAALKLVNPLLLAMAAALACLYGVRRLALPHWVAAAAVVICGAALPVLVFTNVLFSEPLFLVVLFATLLIGERAVESGGWRWAVAAGVSAALAVLVRTAGIALVPAIVVALLVAHRRRDAAIALVVAVAVLAPWQLWVASHEGSLALPLRGSYGPYLDWVLALYRERGAGFVATVARQNIVSLFRTGGIALFLFGPAVLRPLLVMLTLVITGLAMYIARQRASVGVFFFLFYIAMVVAWPYAPDRFLWAIWPLAGLFIASGAVESARIGRAASTTAGATVTAAFACSIGVFALGGHAGYTGRGIARGWWDIAAHRNADALAPVVAWINEHTLPTDIVACDGEPFVHLYTGRIVVPVHVLSPDEYLAGTPIEQAAADLRALITANRPSYMVLSADTPERDAAPMLTGANGTPRLIPIDSLAGGGQAYRVVFP